MKKSIFSLAMMLASVTLSASATSTINSACTDANIINTTGSFDLTKLNGIVVEQTVTFANGKKATVYYKVEDGCVAVYSEADLSHYTLDDLLNVKETKEQKVSAVKGKRYGKYTFAEAKRLVQKWLSL